MLHSLVQVYDNNKLIHLQSCYCHSCISMLFMNSQCLSRQQYSGGGASVKVLMSECEYIHESSKSIVGGPAAWFQFYCSDYNSSKLSFCSVPGIHKQTFFPGSGWFK